MHILESLGEVLASMIVETQVRVAISNGWRVIPMELLLDDQTLGLELDSLEVISKLVLDVGHLRDAGGNICVDCSCNLKKHVDCLSGVLVHRPDMNLTGEPGAIDDHAEARRDNSSR